MPRTAQHQRKRVSTKKGYKICTSCGNFSHVDDNHAFCIVCGDKLIERCPQCRKSIVDPIARFCPACGVRILRLSMQ